MTFRERLEKEHKVYIDEKYSGGCKGCPSDYGYETREQRPCSGEKVHKQDCTKCWNRKMAPPTEFSS